jgi:hypothetical protein
MDPVVEKPEPIPAPEAPGPPGSTAAGPGRLRQAAFAFALYLLASFLLFGLPVLPHFASRFAGSGRGDAKMFAWMLAWWPHAIASGINPFFSHAIWYPGGIGLASLTGIPGPSLAMAPVTVALGPIAAGNVLTVLSPALGGLGAFLLARRLTSRFWASFAGGWLFGFGTYEIGQLRGHINLYLVFVVPLAAYLFVRRLEGSIGRRAFVLLFALALLAQFSISNEVFATATVFGALALAGAYLLGSREGRPELARTAREAAVAFGIAAVVLSPYVYAMAVGVPLTQHPLSRASADLLSYVVPPTTVLMGGSRFASLTGHLASNASEDGAYLGPGLVGLVVTLALAARHDRSIRLLLLFAAVVALASLGPELHVDGRAILPLPWAIAAHVPLLRFALPQRFTMFVWLALGLAVARWLDRTSLPTWRSYGIVALSAVLLLPNLADPLLHRPVRIPQVFRDPAVARRLAPNGGSLLILDRAKGEDMLWQAEDSFAFTMPQGHTGTEPLAFRRDPVWDAIKYEEPQGLLPDQLAKFLRAHDVVAVLVDPSVLGAWSWLLARLGLHGYRNRQITIYPVSPASLGPPEGLPRGQSWPRRSPLPTFARQTRSRPTPRTPAAAIRGSQGRGRRGRAGARPRPPRVGLRAGPPSRRTSRWRAQPSTTGSRRRRRTSRASAPSSTRGRTGRAGCRAGTPPRFPAGSA